VAHLIFQFFARSPTFHFGRLLVLPPLCQHAVELMEALLSLTFHEMLELGLQGLAEGFQLCETIVQISMFAHRRFRLLAYLLLVVDKDALPIVTRGAVLQLGENFEQHLVDLLNFLLPGASLLLNHCQQSIAPCICNFSWGEGHHRVVCHHPPHASI